MDVVEEYLKNLKRLKDGEEYFKRNGLDLNSKEFAAFKKIFNNCMKLYPEAKKRGCDKII